MKVSEYSLQQTVPCHVFTELCQLSPIQLSYQLSSCQFPTRKRSKPGGGGHPNERLQHHPSLTQGGSEKQSGELRWEITIIYNTHFSSYSHVQTAVSLSHPNTEIKHLPSLWVRLYFFYLNSYLHFKWTGKALQTKITGVRLVGTTNIVKIYIYIYNYTASLIPQIHFIAHFFSSCQQCTGRIHDCWYIAVNRMNSVHCTHFLLDNFMGSHNFAFILATFFNCTQYEVTRLLPYLISVMSLGLKKHSQSTIKKH